jgi:hypothetical protein
MLKAVGRFFNSDTSMWILIAVVVVFMGWALMSYSSTKSKFRDSFGTNPNQAQSSLTASSQVVGPQVPVAPIIPPTQARPTLQPSDIVLNPVNAPDLIMSPQAFIGIDTISNWLKNPSYDIRSDPIIPKVDVGPWNLSTFEPDLARVPFEIGSSGR